MRLLIRLAPILLLTGCASSWPYSATADATGCKPNEVKVVSKDSGAFDNIQSWYADCRGTHYRCVFVPGNRGGCYPVNQPG